MASLSFFVAVTRLGPLGLGVVAVVIARNYANVFGWDATQLLIMKSISFIADYVLLTLSKTTLVMNINNILDNFLV